ncbi:hypothetical protein Bca52824_020093 [Brassica carinata]|uniref:Large ribosomal subunit protein bL25 beta domain-containing protein n=1 Tax=Brassica carinata TaxID=52824 RepID=A0A8X7VSZ3_BRACI|nr:hypothetical protein Bca52824_020093 [Brassica carinata]
MVAWPENLRSVTELADLPSSSFNRSRQYHARLLAGDYQLVIGRLAGFPPQSLLETDASKRGVSRKQILDSVGLVSLSSVRPLSSSRSELVKVLRRLLNRAKFFPSSDGEQLKVDVPLVFKGLDHRPGLKKGGNLRSMRSSMKHIGPAEHIPSKIEVDVSKLDIEDKLLCKKLHFIHR